MPLATVPPIADGVLGWAVDVIAALGAPGAGLVLAVENVSPPVPSELVLPLAGFAAARGEFSVLSAIVWTTIGATAGALVLRLVGRVVPAATVRRWLTRLPLVGDRDVDRAEAWFDRHGRAAVLLGRMVPGVRAFISLPAGQRRMPLGEFVLLTAVGSAIWNAAFVLGGYLLGSRWHLVERWAGVLQLAVALAAGALVVVLVVRAGRKIAATRTRRPLARRRRPRRGDHVVAEPAGLVAEAVTLPAAATAREPAGLAGS
jgi:membrane protein DedA with SNARE-associated domain